MLACCIAAIISIFEGTVIRRSSVLMQVGYAALHCLCMVIVDHTIDDVVRLVNDQKLLALATLALQLVFATHVGTFRQKDPGLALLVLTRSRSISLLALKHVDLN